MKKTATVAFSVPCDLLKDIDKLAEDLHVKRSALLTAMLSIIMKWKIEPTLKELLNSIYRKKE